MKKPTGPVNFPEDSITYIIISFQFSPVMTMNIVIKDWIVELNEYLDGFPSSSRSS
jgi:hypothetical protein